MATVAFNPGYLFCTELHETSDVAANSLSVIRASHFKELYGPYSRWQFHQPGAALFYDSAALEWVACSLLHATPTPFNAQVLGPIIPMLLCFSAGIGVDRQFQRC